MSWTTIRISKDTKKKLDCLPGRNYDEKVSMFMVKKDLRIRELVREEIDKLRNY